MQVNGIYPLRRSDGDAVSVSAITTLAFSTHLTANQIAADVRANAAAIEDPNIYRPFHPRNWLTAQSVAHAYAPEVYDYKAPGDLPFNLTQPFASILVTGPKVQDLRDGRKLWAEFRIDLDAPNPRNPPLIGGIYLAAYPYHPAVIEESGEPTSNHGFPREVRIGWRPDGDADFIDADNHHTVQIPAWHSSHHFIPIEPVKTRRLFVRISDFGRYIRSGRSFDNTSGRFPESWGVALPMIVPVLYSPSTIREAALTPGVVCTTQSNAKRGTSFYEVPLSSAASAEYRGAETTWIKIQNNKGYPFTPQSAVVPIKNRRRYPLGQKGDAIEERFITNEFDNEDKVFLLLAQRDEHCRCLAGLRLEFTGKKLRETLGAAKFPGARLQVFECDPLPGTAIPRPLPELLAGRFNRLIAETTIDRDAEGAVDIRFNRVTLSRWIYLAFTMANKGQMAIDAIELLRSSYVSLASRPSRTQHLQAVHFRLLGPSIGDDYARLGEEGFAIAVDRVTAGQKRARLFHAGSLEELVRTGVGKLVLNSRARAAERQSSRTLNGSFLTSSSRSRSDGWERNESGRRVELPPSFSPQDAVMWPNGEHGFTSMSSEETRTHVNHLARVNPSYRRNIESHFSALHAATANNESLLWKDDPNQTNDAIWPAWRTTGTNAANRLKSELNIRGLWNISLPPYHNQFINFIENNGGLNSNIAIEKGLGRFRDKLLLINGGNCSFTFTGSALVVSGSWSNSLSSSGVATALQSHSTGTTGSVARTGRESRYSYNQSVTAGANRSTTTVDYENGVQNTLTVREVPSTEDMANLRIKGAETVFDGQILDLVIGIIPAAVELPALQESGYRTTDEAIRVGFGAQPTTMIVDVWFDVREELTRDDH